MFLAQLQPCARTSLNHGADDGVHPLEEKKSNLPSSWLYRCRLDSLPENTPIIRASNLRVGVLERASSQLAESGLTYPAMPEVGEPHRLLHQRLVALRLTDRPVSRALAGSNPSITFTNGGFLSKALVAASCNAVSSNHPAFVKW